MTGNPTTQNFVCSMTINIPANILGYNTAGILNSIGSGLWTDAIYEALAIERFLGYLNSTQIGISNSKWADNGTNCILNFNLMTVSDPTDANTVQSALITVGGLIVIGIGLVLNASGIWAIGIPLDIIGIIIAFGGSLGFLSVGVTETGKAIMSNPIFIGGAILALAAVAVGIYVYATDKSTQRGVNKAISAGYKRVVG